MISTTLFFTSWEAELVQSQTIRLAKLRKQKMNEVGKKAKLSRDFRSSYAQWLASWKTTPGRLRIDEINTKGRDRLHGTRRAETRPAPRDETNTKGRDRLHGTRRAGTDQEAPRDEINTKERPKQRRKQEKNIKD